MPVRSSEVTWRGGVHDGDGELELGSGAWQGHYSYRSRFEAEEPTKSNPEELLAAGHAGCYLLALGNRLENAGHDPDRAHTTADCHIEMDDEKGSTITRIDLETEVVTDDVSLEPFREMGHAATVSCPVSLAVSAPDTKIDAELVA